MNTKRFFFVMSAAVVLLCLAIIAVTVVGNNLLKGQANKLSDLRAQNQVVEDQKLALIQAKEDIERYRELNEISKSIVPKDKDQARAIREINRFAEESGVVIETVAFDPSSLGEEAPKPAPAAPSDDTGSGGEAAPAPAPAAPTSPITQAEPVEGIPGVYSIPITVSSPAGLGINLYDQLLGFLEKLENNRRTSHVTGINITPEGNGDFVTFSLTLNVYVKP